MMELDSIVAAMTGQSAQTQATCASLMVAHGFFFAAMKAVFVFPEVLRAVLEDIKLQVNQFVSKPRRGLQSFSCQNYQAFKRSIMLSSSCRYMDSSINSATAKQVLWSANDWRVTNGFANRPVKLNKTHLWGSES